MLDVYSQVKLLLLFVSWHIIFPFRLLLEIYNQCLYTDCVSQLKDFMFLLDLSFAGRDCTAGGSAEDGERKSREGKECSDGHCIKSR